MKVSIPFMIFQKRPNLKSFNWVFCYTNKAFTDQTWNNERWQIQIDELLTKQQTQMSYVNEALEQENEILNVINKPVNPNKPCI